MAERKYFHMYHNKGKLIKMLSDEDAGRLIKAVYDYACDGEDFKDEENLGLYFLYIEITEQIDRDFESYRKLCETNRKNALKKYKSATACDGSQEEEKEKEEEEEKEDEKEKEKENAAGGVNNARACGEEFYHDVLNSFNKECASLPGVKKLTSERRRLIENARRVLDELQISFKEYFAKAEKSDYLSGRNGKWKGCGFDWLLKEDNLIRTAEGTYDSGTKARGEPEIRRSYNIDELDKINTL